jgi:(S)-2-hydroxyglutarate dehydrogenase
MTAMTCDFLVVGGGIIGLSIARELRRRHHARVLIIEKEPFPGQHASGRNSGVLHAGVYYKAGTLKARLCVEGNRRMREYCVGRQIPLNQNGKVIVASSDMELPALRELYARSQGNGVRSELIDSQTLKEIEPCAKTVHEALYVKDTAVVNPQRVMEAFVDDACREGVIMQTACAWRRREGKDVALTSGGRITYGHLVNCAGLFADRIAWAHEAGHQYRILPFRGQFYRLRPESKVTVRGNIYPVPDLRNPFLGVHFTRRPEGDVTIGPSALPLLGREQYRGFKGITIQDGLSMARYLFRLYRRNQDHFRSLAGRELLKMSRSGFFREAQGLALGFEVVDLQPGKEPGIRAQLVHSTTAELLNDFVVEPGVKSTHVLNAVSPAFTSSLPFAEHVASGMKLE